MTMCSVVSTARFIFRSCSLSRLTFVLYLYVCASSQAYLLENRCTAAAALEELGSCENYLHATRPQRCRCTAKSGQPSRLSRHITTNLHTEAAVTHCLTMIKANLPSASRTCPERPAVVSAMTCPTFTPIPLTMCMAGAAHINKPSRTAEIGRQFMAIER